MRGTHKEISFKKGGGGRFKIGFPAHCTVSMLPKLVASIKQELFDFSGAQESDDVIAFRENHVVGKSFDIV